MNFTIFFCSSASGAEKGETLEAEVKDLTSQLENTTQLKQKLEEEKENLENEKYVKA